MSGEFLAYDALPYTGEAYPQTHPSALFAAGWLLGMSPADPQQCRVLEIGCADATNLIAMAAGLPQSTFVGVDGSAVQIASGQALIAALGLVNITLHVADLRDFAPPPGSFDYVITHGVYSWVAPDAQAALLALCRTALTEQGIAYVSYNALPGWHACRVVRDLMRYHASKFESLPEQLRQARAILAFVAKSAVQPVYARTLQSFVPYLDRIDDDYLFHDYLEANNDPRMLREFVDEAVAAGLTYLGDAELHRMAGLDLPVSVRAQIEAFTDDPVDQEQYLDLVSDRTLRRTLLCRDGVAPQRSLDLSRAHRLSFTTGLVEEAGSDPVTFRHRRTRDAVVIADPVRVEALRILQAHAPQPVPFVTLALAVGAGGLEGLLLQGVLQGVVAAYDAPIPVTGKVGEYPEVWWLARHLAAQGRPPISRLHHSVPPLSALDPLVIALLNGSRSLSDLVAELQPMVAVDDGDPVAALTEAIEMILERCAREGLLIEKRHDTRILA
ncbi:MAG: class I SAM-dependent methyltransferase [Myxococcota bacterium]|nr:class I SAM-dependent methyltransferase [Myxococcota bacterium]